MIQLNNRAKVHMAIIIPAEPGQKPSGYVLAETSTDWVTWQIYWDGDYTVDDVNEIWECESGHYFQKSMSASPAMGDPKLLAEFNFGMRLSYLVSEAMAKGIRVQLNTLLGVR